MKAFRWITHPLSGSRIPASNFVKIKGIADFMYDFF